MPHALIELNRALVLARLQGQKDAIFQLEMELKLWPSADHPDKPKQGRQ
jgi:hypothetical protein